MKGTKGIARAAALCTLALTALLARPVAGQSGELRIGVLFALVGVSFLVAAFVVHPTPQNLATGYPILLLFGVDALGRMSMTTALAVGALQIAALFAIGLAVGRLASRARRSR